MLEDRDEWGERYSALIPEKFSADDVEELLFLMMSDPERLVVYLREFVEASREWVQGEGRCA